jgi:hypothetical protein
MVIEGNPPHCCAFPKPGPGFLMPYVNIFFLCAPRCEVVVSFVDVGGIVDYQNYV